MVNEVPPFHLRTIPAAIYDDLWVKNPTTNEYEKLSVDSDGIVVDWDDVSNKPTVIAAGDDQESARLAIGAGTSNLKVGNAATDAMAGDTVIPSGDSLVPTVGTNGHILRVVGSKPTWSTEVTYTAMTAAAATAGTSTSAHTISAKVLADAIAERLVAVDTEVDLLQTEINLMQTEIETMQGEIEGLNGLITTLTGRVQALEGA